MINIGVVRRFGAPGAWLFEGPTPTSIGGPTHFLPLLRLYNNKKISSYLIGAPGNLQIVLSYTIVL